LVYRQGVLYLVATAGDYTEVRQFALHRMANATVLDAPATPTKGFDLRRYVEDEKGFDLPAGKTIKLKLKVVPWLARHLDECKLAVDQVIMPIRQDERSKVTATLPETENLYWWLRSLGPDVEVLKPSALRKRIKGDLDAAVRMYA
jgi:predicted DNA-binding transcriptional regulator YafY